MTQTNFEAVGEFMSTFGQDVHSAPFKPSAEIAKLRLRLIFEEFTELAEAMLGNSHNVSDFMIAAKEMNAAINRLSERDFDMDLVEIADALTDIEYVNLGAGHAFGINLDKTFAEVHASNMSKSCLTEKSAMESLAKYDSEGVPSYIDEVNDRYIIKRASDKKVLKGIYYFSPDLGKILYDSTPTK